MRRMTMVALSICALAAPAGAGAQAYPQQQRCAADATQFMQAIELYLHTLEFAVPGQSPDPQTAALELAGSDAQALKWDCS
jgi:hypothetical protein